MLSCSPGARKKYSVLARRSRNRRSYSIVQLSPESFVILLLYSLTRSEVNERFCLEVAFASTIVLPERIRASTLIQSHQLFIHELS